MLQHAIGKTTGGRADIGAMAPLQVDLPSEQRGFQAALTRTLSAHSELIPRNSDLVWCWDFMSLALCLGWPPCAVKSVPTAGPGIELALRPGRLAWSVRATRFLLP